MVLAELFPAAFVADRRQPHRPLAIGIHHALIDRGVLTPHECRGVFRCYILRPAYQRALAAGGPRYGLSGEASGEVTPDQQDAARAMLAIMKARLKTRGKPPSPSPPPVPRRLGLADLKRAAVERRVGAS
jgi:sRNA-binding protein